MHSVDKPTIDGSTPSPNSGDDSSDTRFRSAASVWKLASKELRETLRDRRTLMTLLLMPVLVYPLLGMMFQGFFLPTLTQTETKYRFLVAIESEVEFLEFQRAIPEERQHVVANDRNSSTTTSSRDEEPEEEETEESGLVDFLIRRAFKDGERPKSVETMVADGLVDVGAVLVSSGRFNEPLKASWRIVVRDGSANSRQAAEAIERLFIERNHTESVRVIAANGRQFNDPIEFEKLEIQSNLDAPISIVAIIPLILTLMTITGAVYPAIDLTAGERERGTLESLIAAPIPRMRILLGKFVAVVAVALLTALLNIIGMITTLWVFQLEGMLFPDTGLQLVSFLKLFLLLIVFAGFFSSILLAVTSFARSFKEGQAYLIPVMLFSIGPSLLSLKPELNINGILAIAPLVNIVLLARDVLQGTALLGPALVAIGSTIVYSMLAISFAARVFGTDAVLYGSSGSWKDLFARPAKKQSVTSESTALLCLALLIPGTFLWNGLVGRLAQYGVEVQFGMVVLGMILVFAAIPLLVTSVRRVDLWSGYRLFRFRPMGLVAAVLLGIGLGPLLAQAIIEGLRLQELWFGPSNSEQLLEAGKDQIAKWKLLPWYLLIPALGLVPGIVEELFFRGCLFQSLRKRFSPTSTILITAGVFGLFHLITAGSLGLNRLIPTTLMGIVLGIVCYRTGSVIPGMFLHSIHNMATVSLIYFRDDLVTAGWLDASTESIPLAVLVAGGVLTLLGGLLLIFGVRSTSGTPPISPEIAERPL